MRSNMLITTLLSIFLVPTTVIVNVKAGKAAAAGPGSLERGEVQTVAGSGTSGYSGDGGPADKAQLNQPFGVCFNSKGEMLIADCGNHCIRKVDLKHANTITTIVGTGKKGYTGDGGPAFKATMNEPYAIACDKDDNLFIADRLNACVRFVNSSGNIYTLAGTGVSGFNGDGGIATKAQLKEPNGLALDAHNGLLIADVADNRIRRVDLRNGIISTICGTGKQDGSGDGDVAMQASLDGARAVAVNTEGNIVICERSGNRIREIDHRIGIIRTISGTGKAGYTGDGRASILATFNGPKWVCYGLRDTLFVVDTENHCVRRVDPDTGIVTTVLGCGKKGSTGDGEPPLKARLNRPHGCAIHNGYLYVADSENNRIVGVAIK